MGIKDIVDKAGVNIDYTKVMGQLAGAISSSFHTNGTERMRIDSNGNASFPNWQDVLMNEMDKGMLTIKNPEKLNTGDGLIQGHWGITYGGRDLTLDKDNYHWIVTNRRNGFTGYYIIQRELIKDDWVNVRWGSDKIRKEMSGTIHKSYLKDKVKFQWDIVTHIVQMMPITKGNTPW